MKKHSIFSKWVFRKRRKRKKNQPEVFEQVLSQGLDFITDSSGYKCIPYQFSNQFCEYLISFDENLQRQLNRMKLEECNRDFKRKELHLMLNYEMTNLKSEFLLHQFVNTQIQSQLRSQNEVFETEVALIETVQKILAKECKNETM